MTERTALAAMEAIDKDRWAAHQSVMLVFSVLRDFIPCACISEAEDKLFDAFFINGTELTSNLMRKEYEQWKKLELNILNLTSFPKVQP
jgi:hypothetical protein